MTWYLLLLFLWWCKQVVGEKKDFQTIDVGRLSRDSYGTELILLENSLREEKTYRFEDFFWTGSGDGSTEDDWTTESSKTIYKTKTIVTTVFLETPASSSSNDSTETTTKCSFNCESPSIPDGTINPTPTFSTIDTTTVENEDDFLDADRQFWLLTVLKSDGKDPVIIDLKNSLAKLYKKAFQRQQDRHLGINGRHKREVVDKPVNVYIHKVNKSKLNGDQKIEVLYHVSVSGKPVAAITAADDMNLVSDEEVQKELGYPFLVKAEPYLKPASTQFLSKSQNTWVFIGVSIVGLLVFFLILAFLILGFTKRKRQASNGLDNRRHIFERAVGKDNKGFVEGSDKNDGSPTYINYENQQSSGGPITIRVGVGGSRSHSSLSSSSSSSTSLDISPLMALRKQRTPPKKPPRPKAAINKTAPINRKHLPSEIFDSDSNSSRKDSPDAIYHGANYDPGVMSPKSYLSMPSVKSFPRGNMPEPLNKVLEPVSVLHLDMPVEEPYDNQLKSGIDHTVLVRHGSVGAVEDPGVIGPIVWNMHCKRLQHGVSVDEGIDDLKVASNVSKMRKRFHDLLDDTFSLFGSRRGSPVPSDTRSVPIEVKSHSAVDKTTQGIFIPTPKPRPKTTDPRKLSEVDRLGEPKGAWASTAPSPLVRPLSAGIVGPKINRDHILAEGKFRANDPAIPLIAAIKTEIEKCSLPGSTTDLRD